MLRAAPLLAVLLLLCPLCASKTGKPISKADLDKFLAQDCQKELTECTARDKQWQTWHDNNEPTWDRWNAENDVLRAENVRLAGELATNRNRAIAIAAFGLGFGAVAAFFVSLAVKKVWPLSSQHKQLIVLLMAATWVTGAAIVAASSSHYATAMGVRFAVYSLPGIAFGGVGFWWFGRRIVVRLF